MLQPEADIFTLILTTIPLAVSVSLVYMIQERKKKLTTTIILIEQQVTLYPHRDDNNWWTITKVKDVNATNIEYIKNGDIITFKHADSNKRLHSHDIRPPMTDIEYHNEVR